MNYLAMAVPRALLLSIANGFDMLIRDLTGEERKLSVWVILDYLRIKNKVIHLALSNLSIVFKNFPFFRLRQDFTMK
jgi:hypothetical protein